MNKQSVEKELGWAEIAKLSKSGKDEIVGEFLITNDSFKRLLLNKEAYNEKRKVRLY